MGEKGEMKMMLSLWWPGRRRSTAGIKVMKERSQSRSAVGAAPQVAEMWEPCQELSDLEGCRPHIPRGRGRVMSGTAEEVAHHVVGREAFGAGGVIGPAYRATVGLEPRAVAGTELEEGAAVQLCQLEGGWP